jgi:membrane-associated phospholipid phosphatase
MRPQPSAGTLDTYGRKAIHPKSLGASPMSSPSASARGPALESPGRTADAFFVTKWPRILPRERGLLTSLMALALAFIWGGVIALRAGHVSDPPVYGANLEGIYAAIGHLGDPQMASLVGVVLLVAARHSWRAVAGWIVGLGLGGAIEHATKILTDSGYPSGHTLGAVLVATALASMGRIGILAGAAWIGLMGITQVAVGAHLPIDVIGGLALGGVIGAVWRLRASSPLEVVEGTQPQKARELIQSGATFGQ